MFAVIKTGGKQYRVAADDLVEVDKIAGEAGAAVSFAEVLAVGGEETRLGAPTVAGATVRGEVVEQGRRPKVIAFKKRRRKNSRRKRGHRQEFTLVRITEILTGAEDQAKPAKAKVKSDLPADTAATGVSAERPAPAPLTAEGAERTARAQPKTKSAETSASAPASEGAEKPAAAQPEPETAEKPAPVQPEAQGAEIAGEPAPAAANNEASAKPASPKSRRDKTVPGAAQASEPTAPEEAQDKPK